MQSTVLNKSIQSRSERQSQPWKTSYLVGRLGEEVNHCNKKKKTKEEDTIKAYICVILFSFIPYLIPKGFLIDYRNTP